jgi:hypothetical protein
MLAESPQTPISLFKPVSFTSLIAVVYSKILICICGITPIAYFLQFWEGTPATARQAETFNYTSKSLISHETNLRCSYPDETNCILLFCDL